MAKRDVKKIISEMNEAELRSLILDAYSAKKEIKEYFDFFANPDSEALSQKYKQKIRNEFISRHGFLKRRPRRSVCKKAISNLQSFSPKPECVASVMLYYVDIADRWIRANHRSVSESMAISITETFRTSIDFALKYGLIKQFLPDIQTLINNSERWGIHDYASELRNHLEDAISMSSFFSGSIQAQEDED